MTVHGWGKDEWLKIWEKVKTAEILVVGTPIWLGEESLICRILIERLYAMSGELNDKGQSIYYGKVGGCVITGNEDGIKHTAMTIGNALNHLGYTTPPQADLGWIGEVGPGPSYGDAKEDGGGVGFDNYFTQRNTTIMTWIACISHGFSRSLVASRTRAITVKHGKPENGSASRTRMANRHNKGLHRTAIPLRSKFAAERGVMRKGKMSCAHKYKFDEKENRHEDRCLSVKQRLNEVSFGPIRNERGKPDYF
jgi:multimeric flavodoxin WrbA